MTQSTGRATGKATGRATTIKDAADRLRRAVDVLERNLSPYISRLDDLEAKYAAAQNSEQDRAGLAEELDALKAKYESMVKRESEFTRLANETTLELDSVIAQVLEALGENGGGR